MRELWYNQLSYINYEEQGAFIILISQRVLCSKKNSSVNKQLKQGYFFKYLVTSQQPDNLFTGLS